MSISSDALEISIRSVPDVVSREGRMEDDSMAALLHRLGQQRGSFRNFTEESLLAELSDPTSSSQVNIDRDENASSENLKSEPIPEEAAHVSEGSSATNGKTGAQVREDVLRCIGVALNEAALALDFTSLLLSSSRESASQTISPALKEAVPIASISCTRVRRHVPSTSPSASFHSSLLGFQAQSLNYAVDALRRASQQTQREQALDACFWMEVQTLIDQEWSLFRTRPGHTGISVRFGPGSAHRVPLERDDKGHIDTSRLIHHTSFLVYRICRHHKISARQSEETDSGSMTDNDDDMHDSVSLKIVECLKRARKSVLAFDTFNGFVRECRSLATYGATVIDRKLTIPLSSDADFIISLEDGSVSGEKEPDTEMDEDSNESSEKDEYLLTAVRALISTTPVSPIHCFLNWYNHGAQLSRLVQTLESLVRGLQKYSWSATLPCLTIAELSVLNKKMVPQEAESHLTLEFLGSSQSITIATTTPTMTRYEVKANLVAIPGLPTTTHQLTTFEAESFMQFVQFEILASIMDYLTQNPMLMRSSDAEVRVTQLQNKRVSIELSDDGEISLISEDGLKKLLVRDLSTEILEANGYI